MTKESLKYGFIERKSLDEVEIGELEVMRLETEVLVWIDTASSTGCNQYS